ncbi:MAG: trigger factor, partial [Alphaproteobacteria bacterium]|nr:trigger factor [Alphaproteobacteria bacterium]
PEAIAEKRAAKMGDIAVIDFDGTVDGVAHPGMKADDHRLELGSKSFIGTFEEQIVGMKVGDKKNVKVDFPADYHAANLAGKAAVFAVEMKELRAQKAVEMNAALAEELGFKTLEELRKRIAEEIGAEYARVSRSVLKRKLLDHLAETQKFPVPEGMIEGEFTEIWKQVQQEKAQGTLSKEDAKKSDDALRKEYREISERRIRLGLLLSDLAHKNKVEVSSPELRNAMIAEARRFPGQEKAVLEYFTKTPNAVDRLRAPILEEKVVDFILAQAKITEKKVSVDALMKLVEEID